MDQLHDNIAKKSYEVDPTAVAEAIVRRLLEGRLLALRVEPRG